MADDDDYEAQRRKRMHQNAAKLAELQVASAAGDTRKAAEQAEERRVAARRAARATLAAGAGPRRASNRAAAARTATKLQQQAHSGRTGDDGASSSEENSSDGQPHGPARGSPAAVEYDPLDDAAGNSSSGDDSVSLADSSADEVDRAVPPGRPRSAGDDGRGAAADAISREQEDEQLQQALALSLADGGSTARPPDEGRQPRLPVSTKSSQQRPTTKPTAKRKPAAKAQQEKRRRLEVAAPPSEEDVLAAFELFNQQQMSTIIAADIDKVAGDTLGMDLDSVQLHNMMARACDLLHLQQPRLVFDDFTRLVRHFCG